MGIFIQNLGPTENNQEADRKGEYYYRVAINNKNICFFQHHRKDGLAACLLKASEAVKHQELLDITETYLKLKGEQNEK